MNTSELPLPLAFTPGEPAGIGPDQAILLAQRPRRIPLVALCDPQLLEQRSAALGLPITVVPYEDGEAVTAAGALSAVSVPLETSVEPGVLNPANADYVLQTLRVAVQGCLEGRFAGLVTGPVHKGVINEAGIPFTGHTEFLAELTTTPQVVMMLATPGLRVALATTHLPLSEVSRAITAPRLERTLRILEADLRRHFALARPRILVCGLNPHAGEGGHLGREELEVIGPLVERLQREGMALRGPLPADSLFTPRYLEQSDAVLAMYHDQGLPVLKHKGFGQAVNITLGLPLVRTSVDHGTALELAGSGKAEIGSLEYAIEMAARMAQNRG